HGSLPYPEGARAQFGHAESGGSREDPGDRRPTARDRHIRHRPADRAARPPRRRGRKASVSFIVRPAHPPAYVMKGPFITTYVTKGPFITGESRGERADQPMIAATTTMSRSSPSTLGMTSRRYFGCTRARL